MKGKPKLYIENSIPFYALIVLFCLNLFGRGSIVCLAFGLFALLLLNKELRFDLTSLIVFLLTAAAALASFLYENVTEAVKCLNFVIMYVVGLNAVKMAKNKAALVKRSIFAMFLGYFILVALTYFSNFSNLILGGQRLIRNFWTGEYVSVTLVGLLCSVVIGYFFYTVISGRRLLQLLGVVSIVIVFFVNSMTATRTPIILFAILALVMSAIYIFSEGKTSGIRLFVGILVLLLIFSILYAADVFGIRTLIESTPLYRRFELEGTETNRIAIAREYLSVMLAHPFGGSGAYAEVGVLAHNFLQQGYDLYGFVAGALLMILLVAFVKNVVTLIAKKGKSPIDYLLISIYLAMVLQSFLEPIFTGYPCFFFCLLFIHGMTNGYLRADGEVA